MHRDYESESSIRVEEIHDRDTHWAIRFGVIDGHEQDAADYLLNLVESGVITVSLNNDDDEGGEGTTDFQIVSDWLSYKNAGHGWSGNWNPVARSLASTMIRDLATRNRGGYLLAQGCIIEPKIKDWF